MEHEHPFISCIMPTRNRRQFAAQAIKYFLRQDYPRCELIIFDDGDQAIADLADKHRDIRYLRLDRRATVGEKRNLACEAARGDIIVHWDDDDWMAQWRLRYQVEQLIAADADVCGLSVLLHYDVSNKAGWQYVYPKRERPLVAGGTLCYWKSLWRKRGFDEVDNGEDVRFLLNDVDKKIMILEDRRFYVAVIHDANTSRRQISRPRWMPYSVNTIRSLLGDAWDFYDRTRELASAVTAMEPVVTRGEPLVSCIMPTRNRRWFVERAVGYFQRQRYPNKELIVVDDGDDPISDLLVHDPRIKYVRLDGRYSVGYKRNTGIENSGGHIIAQWDDDDWYSADRIDAQIRPILHDGARISGLRADVIYDISESTFWRCSEDLHRRMFYADVHGRSLMYARDVWESHVRFIDKSVGEDAIFLKQALAKQLSLARVEDPDKLIYIRHRDNAWRFDCGTFLDPGGWQRIDAPSYFTDADHALYRVYPRVSCIMPTYNRCHFVPQAINYFLRQDYPNRELIIVDDGSTPVNDLIPDDPRISLIQLARKTATGTKRNMACEQATGDMIMLWDDDDWYADSRITHQIQPLLDGNADVTGFSNCLLLCLPTREFWVCRRHLHEKMFFAGIIGGTLAFRKKFWRQGARFPNTSLGEDAQLLKILLKKGARIQKLTNKDIFIYIRHHSNSWKFMAGSFIDRQAWEKVNKPAFVPRQDLLFYGL